MPKLKTEFPEQINFLARAGTLDQLIAIAYMRGEAGKYAGPVRDFVAEGVARWTESLSAADRKRFESILKDVRLATATRKAIKTQA